MDDSFHNVDYATTGEPVRDDEIAEWRQRGTARAAAEAALLVEWEPFSTPSGVPRFRRYSDGAVIGWNQAWASSE